MSSKYIMGWPGLQNDNGFVLIKRDLQYLCDENKSIRN